MTPWRLFNILKLFSISEILAQYVLFDNKMYRYMDHILYKWEKRKTAFK